MIELAVEIVQGCVLVGLLIAVILMNRAASEEKRRTKSALGAVERRLETSIGEVTALCHSVDGRMREAELGLAGIKPQLEHLSSRMDSLSESVARCATRDDVARLLGKLDQVGSQVAMVSAEMKAKS